MDLETIILIKSDRKRQILFDIVYIWNVKSDTIKNDTIFNLQNGNKLTYIENKLIAIKGERRGFWIRNLGLKCIHYYI